MWKGGKIVALSGWDYSQTVVFPEARDRRNLFSENISINQMDSC